VNWLLVKLLLWIVNGEWQEEKHRL